MREVACYASWERSDQEVMLLELAKRSLNLRPQVEQEHLPIRCHLLLLGMVRRSNDNGFMFLPEPLPHDTTTVMTVANEYPRLVVDQPLHELVVMLIGRSKHQCRQSVHVVNGSMELEPIVPTLPVLTELGNSFGHLVTFSPDWFADW